MQTNGDITVIGSVINMLAAGEHKTMASHLRHSAVIGCR